MPTEEMKTLKVMYRNYRKEFARRSLMPIRIWFGVSEYHLPDGPQWFLEARDTAKGEKRDFAVKDMIGWAEWERLKDRERPIEYDNFTAAECSLGFLLEEKIGNPEGIPRSPLYIQDEIEGLLEMLHVCVGTFEDMALIMEQEDPAKWMELIAQKLASVRENQFHLHNTLPRGHKILEQADNFESRTVTQTVRRPDGTEYLRMVDHDEAYGREMPNV